MPTPLTSSTGSQPQIVLDWSNLFREENYQEAYDVDSMIQWVQSFPQASNIHVVLGRPTSRFTGRRLQGALQALGCKVTARHKV